VQAPAAAHLSLLLKVTKYVFRRDVNPDVSLALDLKEELPRIVIPASASTSAIIRPKAFTRSWPK
jgi:hypothetical protein